MFYVFLLTTLFTVLAFVFIIMIYNFANKTNSKVNKRLEKYALTHGTKYESVSPLLINIRKADKTGSIFVKLSNQLAFADIALKPTELLLIWFLALTLPAIFVFIVFSNIYFAAVLFVLGIIIPPLIINVQKKKRIALFEKQFSDALMIIGNCLRAGFTYKQSMESIANEMPNPISKEFGKTLREINYGVSMEAALSNMSDRLQNDDLDLFVTSVVVQRQIGGNLAEIIDNISETIKERLKIKSEIKVLTSSGRISGIIVGLLPLILAGILMVLNPQYLSSFFQAKLGMYLCGFAIVMEVTGFLIVRKIVNIKF